jgi:hypothetical protein
MTRADLGSSRRALYGGAFLDDGYSVLAGTSFRVVRQLA